MIKSPGPFSIGAAALMLGAAALASRFLGVVRERLLVGHFGVGDALDAYYAAFQVPNFLFNLLILGTLSVAFIPVFTEYWEKKKHDEAWRGANTILNLAAITMGALCLALAVAAPAFVRLVAPGFSGEKLNETISLTRLMMVTPWFFSLSSVFGSVVNSFKRFAVVALAPLLYNLGIIFGILVLAPRYGIRGVAYGVIAGAFLHALVHVPAIVRVGFRYQLMLDLQLRSVREIGRLFFSRIWGIDISALALLVGSIIGSTLASGSVALYNLTVNIALVPVGIFAVSYAVAIFPVLSGAAATGEQENFTKHFSATARQILFYLVPASVIMIVLRAHIVRLILGTENLSWDDTRLAAASLAALAATLFLQGLVPLLARAYYAMKNTVIPVAVSLIALVVHIAAAFVLVSWLRSDSGIAHTLAELFRVQGINNVGVLALPLAFSCAVIVQTVLLIFMYRRKFGRLDGYRIARSLGLIAIASLGAGIFTYGGLYLAEGFGQSRTFVGILIQTAVAGALGVISYLGIALFLRSREAWIFVGSFRRKLFRLVRPPAPHDVDTVA